MPSLIKDKSGTFYIVFADQNKRIWRSLKTKDRREAYKRFLSEQNGKPSKKGLTLLRAGDEYLSFVKTNLSPKTHEAYTKTFKHLRTHFGDCPVEKLTSREIELYKSERSSKVSAQTVNHELRMVRAFFNRLKDWDLVTENPCDRVGDIRVVETTRPYLNSADLGKLLDHLKGSSLRDVVLFAAMTGLRRGEIVNLRWTDVDLERNLIIVRSSVSYQTKAGKIRNVPLNSAAKSILETRGRVAEFVFPGKRGGRLNGNFIRARFKKAVRDCGLEPILHFHSLRHTFASLLVQRGISLYHVQKLLGHSSTRVTEIYAHLSGAELQPSVDKLSIFRPEG